MISQSIVIAAMWYLVKKYIPNLCMCVIVGASVCVCVCVCVPVYVHVCAHVHVRARVCICLCVPMCIFVCACVHACVCALVRVCGAGLGESRRGRWPALVQDILGSVAVEVHQEGVADVIQEVLVLGTALLVAVDEAPDESEGRRREINEYTKTTRGIAP